jgi:hypothetical protein
MLGQIRWSKSLVEFIGQIHGSNLSVKLLVELLDQIGRSNSWIKFRGQICWSNLLVKCRQSSARNVRA